MYGVAPIFRPGFGAAARAAKQDEERRERVARRSARAEPGAWRGRPHDGATVSSVKKLVVGTAFTYGEIAERTGVGRASICRWTQDGGWRRPPGAPVATDTVGGERASAKLRARTLHRRAQAIAEGLLDELEREPGTDIETIAAALEMLKAAKLARNPRPHAGRRSAPRPERAAPSRQSRPGPLPSPHREEVLRRWCEDRAAAAPRSTSRTRRHAAMLQPG